MSAHKGVESWGWQRGKDIDFKMEADHNWNLVMRLQGCAGSLVPDMYVEISTE